MDNTRVQIELFPRTDFNIYGNAAILGNPYDPATFPGVDQLVQSFRRTHNLSLSQDAEVRPGSTGQGGGSSSTFDPATGNWFVSSDRTPRQSHYLYETRATYVPSLPTGWSTVSDRLASRRTSPVFFSGMDTAWITANLQAAPFDPAIMPAIVQLAAEARYWAVQRLPLAPDVGVRNHDAGGAQAAAFDPSQESWVTDSTRPAKSRYWTSQQPDTAWIFKNLPASFDPSTQPWKTDSERPKRTQRWDDTNTSPSWIYQNLPVSFDPSTQPWITHSQRPARLQKWPDTHGQPSWLVPSVVYDPQFFAATSIPDKRLSKPVPRYIETNLDNAWVYTSIPVAGFDPATMAAILQLAEDARYWGLQRLPLAPDVGTRNHDASPPPPPYDPTGLAWWVYDERMRARKWWTGQQPNVDWIFQNLPAPPPPFDPINFPWNVLSYPMPRRKGLPEQFLAPQRSPAAILNTQLVLPAWLELLHSFRTNKRAQCWVDTQRDAGFIFQNLPIPFDPQYLAHWSDDRARDRYKKVPRLDAPLQSWIYYSVPAFDPSTESWVVPSIPYQSRKWWSDSPQQQAWLVPSVIYDPQFTPQTDSQRLWNKPRGRWQPDPDQAWIYTSLPVPFDPAIQQWSILTSTYKIRQWWTDSPQQQAWLVPAAIFDPRFFPRTDYQRMAPGIKLCLVCGRYYYDLAFVRDVLGLPDPQPPLARLLTCTGCGM